MFSNKNEFTTVSKPEKILDVNEVSVAWSQDVTDWRTPIHQQGGAGAGARIELEHGPAGEGGPGAGRLTRVLRLARTANPNSLSPLGGGWAHPSRRHLVSALL